MLPHVAALNLLSAMGSSEISQESEAQSHVSTPITSSHHYTWLESDHPYKPATVSRYKVTFSDEEVEEDLELMQETAKRIFSAHSTLLGRGFALASPPTVLQALDGVLPFR